MIPYKSVIACPSMYEFVLYSPYTTHTSNNCANFSGSGRIITIVITLSITMSYRHDELVNLLGFIGDFRK